LIREIAFNLFHSPDASFLPPQKKKEEILFLGKEDKGVRFLFSGGERQALYNLPFPLLMRSGVLPRY